MAQPKPPPPVTVEIRRGSSVIRIRGKRSTKGWNVFQVDGAKSDFMGFRKAKEDAVQLAGDCCEPGTVGTYLVTPA